MVKHAVTMRILSILLSLSMVLSTIGSGTAGFDCAANVSDSQGHGASYTYYVSGSPATKTDASGTTVYTYDGQNRLKTATCSDGTKDVYTFDDNGNRLTKTFTDSEGIVTVTSYEYDKANRLTKSTEGEVATVYSYDKAGNLLNKTTGEKTVTHSYDLLGRLISYTDGETVASYDYYTSNMRRSKTVNGETTTHIWIGNDIAVDMGANAASYLKGIRLVWSDYGYYLYNSHGDVVQLLGEEGSVIRSYDYDAFGIQKGEEPTAPDLNPYRYSGEYTDRESGYNYLRARYYDPTIGRFITADNHWNVGNMLYGDDPIKFGGIYVPFIAAMIQSGNLYVYCMNNPLLYFDSDGTFSLSNLFKVAIGVAAIAVGVAVTVATGGAAGVAVAAGIKTALTVGAISAGTSAVTAAAKSVINGDDFKTAAKKVVDSAVDGFCDGFMTGEIMAGASMTYGSLLKNANGFKIGSTAKPQYGKVNVGYGNPSTNGNTIISLNNNAGKSVFRIEADAVNILHMHYGKTKAALKIHRTGIVQTVAGVLSSE